MSTPKAFVSRLQRIELIKIVKKNLSILVTKTGVVPDKIIFVKEAIHKIFLTRSVIPNEKFKNHSMQEIREKIHQYLVDDETATPIF
ncbi:MAG: hypothetical protein Ct9H300mP21_07710 [Pseudomonadota bacterium]|nr:MAG: hypothetical protein Ct9H300mP21_07710 [Pseudomonadota bacterium]